MKDRLSKGVRRRGPGRSAHTLLEILVVVALLATLGAVVLPSVGAMVAGGSVKAAHETLSAAVDEARVRARRANACFVLMLDSSRGQPRVVLRTTGDDATASGETLAKLPESVMVAWARSQDESESPALIENPASAPDEGTQAGSPADGEQLMELCLVLPDGSLAPSGASRQTLRLTGRSGETLDFVLGRWRGPAVSQPAEPPSPENTATESSPSVRPVAEPPVEPVGGPRDEEQDLLDP
jgi:type II secretory pathway pseudopilin PulG